MCWNSALRLILNQVLPAHQGVCGIYPGIQGIIGNIFPCHDVDLAMNVTLIYPCHATMALVAMILLVSHMVLGWK